ncbi:MAG TPA: hypothetical protein VHL58_16440 [Thermoanaerobaculia bacterium]|nr:hypothetical protein [Thermoanaerobaculia bacterium]
MDNDWSPAGDPRQGKSASCQPLLDEATPDIFRVNAFRITGLPVDATTREISKHVDKLKMMEELGHGRSVHTGAFALEPPPTVDQIREAIQRLRNPEQRIIDEFFWFWPRQFGESKSDPAIIALNAGEPDTALRIWTSLETSPAVGVMAMHNVAVLRHLLAIEHENQLCVSPFAPNSEQRRDIDRHWREAFKRWELLALDDLLWNTVSARIRQIDDPRLTTEFSKRMRATLPEALDKINAEFAVRFAEQGHGDRAQAHVQFMRETNQGLDDVEKTAQTVLTPATTRLKHLIQRTQQRVEDKPADALIAVRELLDHARGTLSLFELFFGKESDERNELSDEVARVSNLLLVGGHEPTKNDEEYIDALRAVIPFSTSIDLRQRIEKNIVTLTGNVSFKQLEPAYAVLSALQASTEHPSIRLQRFRTEAASLIATFSESMRESEAYSELLDSAAIVLRGISLDSWNTHDDFGLAVEATKVALHYARDPDLRGRLSADQTTLQEMAAHATAAMQQAAAARSNASKTSTQNKVLVALAVLGVGWCAVMSDDPSSRSSPASNPPVASNTVSDVSTSPGQATFRVSAAESAELERDGAEVDAAKREVQSLERDLEALEGEIKRDKLLLDNTNEFEVDSYNGKLRRYREVFARYEVQLQRAKALIAAYNAKLQQYGTN